jgi:predicted membrane channel-forming protein YqfA (hemolysin III family)
MTSRFASNLAALLAGAFLACCTFAFRDTTVGWLALAVGCATALGVAGAFATRDRGQAQRAFDLCLFIVSIWTIVFSRTFAGAQLRWLAFASAALMAVFAFAGLIVHEVLLELELRRRRERSATALPAGAADRHALGRAA